ncbi:Ger(x)C family spore germination C-terminal domain-containing protein [Paenibacillus solisilvae]|uniref:Ger(X)C family spore germination C-terminal domain-containing protein n=1 Tax=Paenibacillus solisilvae TaxID=2486751 RepID=A0ABW0VXZ5_9BACL
MKLKLGQIGIVQDEKLTGWLSEQDGLGTIWLAGQIKSTTMAFSCNEDEKVPTSSFRVIKANTKVTPQVINGRIRMRVNVKTSGTLMEYRCAEDLSTPASITKVEQAIAEQLKRIMMKSWEALQKQRADIVGFGTLIHEKYPRYWKSIASSWNDRLDNVELDLRVKVKINRVGMSSKSFESILNESKQ